MIPLLILGAGSMAVEAFEIAQAANQFEILGFLVNQDPAPDTLLGLPVHRAETLSIAPSACRLATGIVSNRRRPFIEQMAALGFQFASLIHPSAIISPSARLGEGCLIHPGVIIASNTQIASHVLINRGALIGHDNRIESFTTIGPGANLAGALHIGSGAYIGVGAVIRDHLTIGAGAVVAAGAVVVKSVDANTLSAGLPAKTMQTGVDGL